MNSPGYSARRFSLRVAAATARIYIEKLNGPFLFGDKGTPAEYKAGELHDSGTFVKLTQSGAGLFA